jgi:hypothetical protein
MPLYHFIWNDEIAAHLAEHNVSRGEFEHVVLNPIRRGLSRSTDLPVVWGYAPDGRYLIAIYEQIDELTVLPVTAYEVAEPR